jgi:hypothetical protein
MFLEGELPVDKRFTEGNIVVDKFVRERLNELLNITGHHLLLKSILK